jgi:hypothetical protein
MLATTVPSNTIAIAAGPMAGPSGANAIKP